MNFKYKKRPFNIEGSFNKNFKNSYLRILTVLEAFPIVTLTK